jgi:hypothetical protein
VRCVAASLPSERGEEEQGRREGKKKREEEKGRREGAAAQSK